MLILALAIVVLAKVNMLMFGVNAFYDHVFKGGYKRVSGGVEYVAGLNEFHANLYRNLGTDDRKIYRTPWT